jgi:hypothetical protein
MVLPRWVVGLLVAACVLCLVAVSFLLGRVTVSSPPPSATGAPASGGAAPSASRATTPDVLSTPATETAPEVAPGFAATELERASTPQGPEGTGRDLAPLPPAGANPDSAAVAAYFGRMDTVAAQVKAAQDPEALARTILDQTMSGNMTGFDELIATQRGLQARMAEVVPPSSCREHHERSLRLVGRAIALLERTRDAVASKNTPALASVATEGRAIEEEAKATDALANDLRRAAGLPVVP